MKRYILTRKEILSYFSNYGYTIEDDGNILHIYSEAKEDFIYLPSRRWYFRCYVGLTLRVYHHTLAVPFSVEWHRFLFTTYLNREVHSVINKNNNMESTYSHAQVRDYLSMYYVQTFRKNGNDHFYNHSNRRTIPLPFEKKEFTHEEVRSILSVNTTLHKDKEVQRFCTFIMNSQNTTS